MDISGSLASLKGIHDPKMVSMWPLTFGWYVLAVVFLIILVIVLVVAIKRYRAYWQYKKISLQFEKLVTQYHRSEIDETEVLAIVSVFLKQVVLQFLPQRAAQDLYGDEWLKFLDECAGTSEFSSGVGRQLGHAYEKNYAIENSEDFFALIQQWLRKVL